jgi:hypothetical protein
VFPIPFQLVLAWHPSSSTSAELAHRIRARFQGDDVENGAAEAGINTGSLRLDTDVVNRSTPAHAWHWKGHEYRGPLPLEADPETRTLVVAFIDRDFVSDAAYLAWLEDAHERIQANDHHVIFPVLMTEGDDRLYFAAGGKLLSQVQGLRYFSQPDAPLRPAHLMLRLVYEACRLLGGKGVRVFLSHAKADALPLVQSFRSLIGDLAWLPYFYDVKDLAPGQKWQHELRKGVRESALIIVRTGAYDGREWCRAEVDEALLHRVAMVVVETAERSHRDQNPAYLNNLPVVRVGDGDLFRPLDALLREQLRCLILRRLVEQLKARRWLTPKRTVLLVRPPELADLFRFKDEIGAGGKTIVYPGPSMPSNERQMLEAVAKAMFRCRLKSTDDFYGFAR